MTCWSCQKPVSTNGTETLCASCGAIQPLPPGSDHFAIFGFPRRFEVDLPALEKRFRELSFQVHPDRFARKAPRERRIALERSTALNDAYRTLKDPLRRATYLLSLNGLKVESESGGSAMGQLPPEFLEEIMELREGLMDAQAEGNAEATRKLLERAWWPSPSASACWRTRWGRPRTICRSPSEGWPCRSRSSWPIATAIRSFSWWR
jgi:molecular chaperone HscB